MKKLAIVFWILLFLGGCITSVSRKYYQLHIPGNTNLALPTIDKILFIEPVAVDNFYDDFRIIYRISPFELNYYSYNFWAEKPARLIRNSIYDFFSRNKIFKKVTLVLSEENPDLVFKSKIFIIEEVDARESWFARLSMEIELKDYSSGRILVTHRFDRKEKLPAKEVSEVPVILSRILREELDTVIQRLSGL
ncbi:MAG: ABC-type transport auxiliary lipoprotein family protein [Candidatus Aminicenantales bacterium]